MIEKEIKKIDKSNMRDLLIKFGEHCRSGYSLLPSFIPENIKFNKIIYCGMGGSAISGDILKFIVEKHSQIPFAISRDYDIPSFADNETIVFITSYSGNTEETISTFTQAIEKKANTFIISSNGELEKLSVEKNLPYIKIPSGMPPRCAFGYLFFASYRILQQLGLLPEIEKKLFQKIDEIVKSFSETENNYAITIAKKIHNKVPILYSDNFIFGCLLRWKTQIAENSKTFSFINVFPEMNHNEIMSFHFPVWFLKKIICLFFIHNEENNRTKKRFEITEKIIQGKGIETLKVEGKGNSLIEKMLYFVILGDWVSYYLSLLNKIDPTEIKEIIYLKDQLKGGKFE